MLLMILFQLGCYCLRKYLINRTYQQDWLIPEILNSIKENNKCILNGNIDAYKILRNKVSAMIDIANKKTHKFKAEDGKKILAPSGKYLMKWG